MRTVLTICLISIFLTSCSTLSLSGKEKWVNPVKPKITPVVVVPVIEADVRDDGFYMDRQDTQNLANNVAELKAYIKKLELQIKEMKKYYGAK